MAAAAAATIRCLVVRGPCRPAGFAVAWLRCPCLGPFLVSAVVRRVVSKAKAHLEMHSACCRFYLRRLLQSLLEQQKQEALAALPQCDLLQLALPLGTSGQQQGHDARRQHVMPEAGPSGGGEASSLKAASDAAAAAGGGLSQEQAAALSLLEAAVTEHQLASPGPPPPVVTSVIATLAAQSAQALLDVLLCLRRRSPALAAHLLLHGLQPAGWEVLSSCIERRQEELAEAGEQLLLLSKQPLAPCLSKACALLWGVESARLHEPTWLHTGNLCDAPSAPHHTLAACLLPCALGRRRLCRGAGGGRRLRGAVLGRARPLGAAGRHPGCQAGLRSAGAAGGAGRRACRLPVSALALRLAACKPRATAHNTAGTTPATLLWLLCWQLW